MRPHGTVARYSRQKCRCKRCTEANKLYQRARRTYKIVEFEPFAWVPTNGCLPALCWCEAQVMKVPVEDIRACRTLSCGEPDCRPDVMATT
jgi:hypothetical protein